jgi:hypothetical protein
MTILAFGGARANRIWALGLRPKVACADRASENGDPGLLFEGAVGCAGAKERL